MQEDGGSAEKEQQQSMMKAVTTKPRSSSLSKLEESEFESAIAEFEKALEEDRNRCRTARKQVPNIDRNWIKGLQERLSKDSS